MIFHKKNRKKFKVVIDNVNIEQVARFSQISSR